MSGCYGGLQALIRDKRHQELLPELTTNVFNGEVLASKGSSPTLKQVPEDVASLVNFIKTWTTQAKFFYKYVLSY